MFLRRILPVLAFACSVVRAENPPPVQIERAWLQAVPPVADATAAYMKITNLSRFPVDLVGASSPIASKIEPMITTRTSHNGQEIMGMGEVEKLEIPAGGVLELKPGGNHLMVIGLISHPKEGDIIRMTLRFAPAQQTIDVQIPVLRQEPK